MSRLGRGFPNNALMRQMPPKIPVSYDATGAGSYSASSVSSLSWSHTIRGNCVLMAVNYEQSGATFPTFTPAVGATTLARLGSNTYYVTAGGFYIWVLLFGAVGVPNGTQTVSISSSTATQYWSANSVSYYNVSSFGTPVYASGAAATLASVSASSAPRQMVTSIIGGFDVGYTSVNQTQRWNPAYPASSPHPTVIQDAPGAATVTFTASPNQSAAGWGALAVPLVGA